MGKLLVADNVTPALVRIVAGTANVANELSNDYPDIVVTHGYDGEHKVGSLHKVYAAVDLRTKNLRSEEQKNVLFIHLRAKFPAPRFDVIFEDRGGLNEHIHIEDNSARTEVPK